MNGVDIRKWPCCMSTVREIPVNPDFDFVPCPPPIEELEPGGRQALRSIVDSPPRGSAVPSSVRVSIYLDRVSIMLTPILIVSRRGPLCARFVGSEVSCKHYRIV